MTDELEVLEENTARIGDLIDVEKWRDMARRREADADGKRRVKQQTCLLLAETDLWDKVRAFPLGFRKRKEPGKYGRWIYACSAEEEWPQQINTALDLLEATCDRELVLANETEIRRRLAARLRMWSVADEKTFRGVTDEGAFDGPELE